MKRVVVADAVAGVCSHCSAKIERQDKKSYKRKSVGSRLTYNKTELGVSVSAALNISGIAG
jgi:hypothetical protein